MKYILLALMAGLMIWGYLLDIQYLSSLPQ